MDAAAMGRQLKTWRIQRGWSQQICAEKVGISTRYLADIERGDKIPRTETLITLLNVLDASADEVLQDSLRVCGYKVKSCALAEKIAALEPSRRRAVLQILESTLEAVETI